MVGDVLVWATMGWWLFFGVLGGAGIFVKRKEVGGRGLFGQRGGGRELDVIVGVCRGCWNFLYG